jgi:hypothetical protein
MPRTLAEIVGAIVDELTPLGSDERKRAVHAAMTLLGEDVIGVNTSAANTSAASTHQNRADGADGTEALPPRVRSWMRQNNLSMDHVQHVFHINNDTAEIIAEIPGRNNREKVRNAYVLTGISNFLVTGEQRFDDTTARGLCERVGIYDSTNHAKSMKGGNEFVGSRSGGWTITSPGLKHAAGLILELSST